MKVKKKVDVVVDFNCGDVIEWMETTDELLSFSQALELYEDASRLFERTTRTTPIERFRADWLKLDDGDKVKFIKWVNKQEV